MRSIEIANERSTRASFLSSIVVFYQRAPAENYYRFTLTEKIERPFYHCPTYHCLPYSRHVQRLLALPLEIETKNMLRLLCGL